MKGRIIFMGTPAFAVASLNALVEAGFEVAAVVTAPDRPAGRGLQLKASAVKERATALGLPVLQPEKLRDPAFLEALDRADADLYVVVAFRMLPEVVWSRPRLGTINLHGSLLPDYRGAAPINWAVMNGEPRTGVTTFFIRQQIDTGDVIDREEIAIDADETAGELHDRLMHLGGALLARTVGAILDGRAQRIAQGTLANAPLHEAPKLTPANCRIDVGLSAKAVHDHVRGLSPFPGAWAELLIDERAPMHFKVLRSRIRRTDGTNAAPGTLTVQDGGLVLQCGTGELDLLEVQPEGKRRMPAGELLRGLRFERTLLLR